MSKGKAIAFLVALVVFPLVGYAVGDLLGLIIGAMAVLIGSGSIGLTKDISDAGKHAREQREKEKQS